MNCPLNILDLITMKGFQIFFACTPPLWDISYAENKNRLIYFLNRRYLIGNRQIFVFPADRNIYSISIFTFPLLLTL
jgi:hypothetical protein